MPNNTTTEATVLHHVEQIEQGIVMLANRIERVLQRAQMPGELLNQLVDPALDIQRTLTQIVNNQAHQMQEIAQLRAAFELHIGAAGLEERTHGG